MTNEQNEQNEQNEVRELTLEEMDSIAGGAKEEGVKRNQEQADK